MKLPRISIRLLFLIVAAFSIPFAVDQLLETRIRTLDQAIANDPISVIGDLPEVKGFKQVYTDWNCSNTSTLAERLTFRRELVVTFDEIMYIESERGATDAVVYERKKRLLLTPISMQVD